MPLSVARTVVPSCKRFADRRWSRRHRTWCAREDLLTRSPQGHSMRHVAAKQDMVGIRRPGHLPLKVASQTA